MEKNEPIYSVSRYVNLYRHYVEQNGSSLKKIKVVIHSLTGRFMSIEN